MSQDPKDERAHRARIEAYSFKVQQLYNATLKEYASLIKDLAIDIDKPFSFADYPASQKRLKQTLQNYANRLEFIINRSTTAEWYAAMKKADTRSPINNIYTARNKEALKAFQERTTNGLNLSKRVWKYTEQFQQEIEFAMSSGLIEGTSAGEIARSIKKHLNEPDKLFRRVRDKHGVLRLSKNAKAYHPGQGVYRSSYKNALRLVRNETNMAYRSADHFRWNNDPAVIGFEVKLSNRHVVKDMCDSLIGKYPKTFKFVGWHVNCLCYKVPILMNDEDFDKYQQSILDGEEYNSKPAGTIENMPNGFNDWIEKNRERIERMKSKPYFVQDNFVDGKLSSGLKKSIIADTLDKKHFELTKEIIDELTASRNINFWGDGTIEEYNKILSGFNLRDFDNDVTELFRSSGIEIKDKNIELRGDKVIITYDSPALKGHKRGLSLQRTFHLGKGLKTVEHNYFELPDSLQGGGISKKLFNILYREYKNTGVEIIKVHANIDVGGYTWGKYGFGAPDKRSLGDVIPRANRMLSKEDLDDFNKWIEKSEKIGFFPMNEIANRSYGKNLLLKSDWYGLIDLRDSVRREIFESYLMTK